MDMLKKYWPHAYKADSVGSLIVTLIIYALIDLVVGWVIAIVGILPLIGIFCSLAAGLLGLYCTVGIVLAILHFLKILK
jgi:hypothetical protein